MSDAMKHLWTALYVTVVHFPLAAVVSGLIGPRAGVMFWLMAITAHWPLRLLTRTSFLRRLAIWAAAVTVGWMAGVTLAIAVALSGVGVALNLSLWAGSVSSGVPVDPLFWLGIAISSAPIIVAGTVSRVLARRAHAPSTPVTSRTNRPEGPQHVRPTQEPEHEQKSPRTTGRIAREMLWFVGCVVAVGALIVVGLGLKQVDWSDVDWSAVTLVMFAGYVLVTLVRAVVWLMRGGGRRFQHWPAVTLIVGVCALAYGGSGVIGSDGEAGTDRYLATVGAGLTVTGVLLRRRLPASEAADQCVR